MSHEYIEYIYIFTNYLKIFVQKQIILNQIWNALYIEKHICL